MQADAGLSARCGRSHRRALVECRSAAVRLHNLESRGPRPRLRQSERARARAWPGGARRARPHPSALAAQLRTGGHSPKVRVSRTSPIGPSPSRHLADLHKSTRLKRRSRQQHDRLFDTHPGACPFHPTRRGRLRRCRLGRAIAGRAIVARRKTHRGKRNWLVPTGQTRLTKEDQMGALWTYTDCHRSCGIDVACHCSAKHSVVAVGWPNFGRTGSVGGHSQLSPLPQQAATYQLPQKWPAAVAMTLDNAPATTSGQGPPKLPRVVTQAVPVILGPNQQCQKSLS